MKKIMFNDRYGLTQAVLEGRKTVTRRVMKNQPGYLEGYINYTKPGSDLVYIRADLDSAFHEDCPYAIGEIVAVAQRYQELDNESCRNHVGVHPAESPYSSCENMAGWNNKMFVRAEACKHQIRITSVRSERLQDITDEDCMKEGIQVLDGRYYYRDSEGRIVDDFDNPRAAFASLINKISGRGTWERNPFVWVYEFKLVK